MGRKNGLLKKALALVLVCCLLSAAIGPVGGQAASAAADVAFDGAIDPITVNGADVFVYIPDGIILDRWTAPIIQVFGDEKFTAASAKQTALDSGLAEIADKEHACIAFVNPLGATWGADDVKTYLDVVDKYAERPNNTWSNGKTSAGLYQGYLFRIVVLGDGAGADFASKYLTDDYLTQDQSNHRIPAAFMLFNTSEPPSDKATITREFPAVVVNGSPGVGDAYAALNKDPGHVMVTTSTVTSGFDPVALAAGYKSVAGRVYRQQLGYTNYGTLDWSSGVFDIPDYEELGVEVQYNTKSIGTANISYHQYIPGYIDRDKPGSVPLVMCFHGMGEKSEYYSMLSGWPEVGNREGFMTVIVDQHLSYSSAQMSQLLDAILAEFPFIDTSRIYATGFSMGSQKTWQMVHGYAERFAAVSPWDVFTSPGATAKRDYIVPTIYFNGQQDYIVPMPISSSNATCLQYLYDINKCGSYGFSTDIDNVWRTNSFDSSVSIPAPHGTNNVITINSKLSEDGECYTKLVDHSNLSHVLTQDHTQIAWDFMKQFSRNEDGSISIADDSGHTGRILPYQMNDTDAFAFVPDGLEGGRRGAGRGNTTAIQQIAPVILVYGDAPFTAETALQTAYKSGLAEIAAKEGAVISFVNPKNGATWSADDVATYSGIVQNKYVERPAQSLEPVDGVYPATAAAPGGQFAGYFYRTIVVAEGSGADFAAQYLMSDYLVDSRNIQTIPASLMLFDVTAVPGGNAGAEGQEYPTVIVNGAPAAIDAVAELNNNPDYLMTATSDNKGFDSALVLEGYRNLTGLMVRPQMSYSPLPNYYIGLFKLSNNLELDDQYSDYGFTSKTVIGGTAYYDYYIPKSIDLDAEKSTPLVMVFHGSGESSEYIAKMGGWTRLGYEEGFMTVSVDNHGSAAIQHALLDALLAEYPFLDPTRIYVSGFSMGGGKTWSMIETEEFAQRIAGISPWSYMTAPGASVQRTTAVPTFYCHGHWDTTARMPGNSTSQSNMNGLISRINWALEINKTGFEYSVNGFPASTPWGFPQEITGSDRYSVETIAAKSWIGDISIHTFESLDGDIYTKFVDASNFGHSISGDFAPLAWEFLKQFSRNEDGSISIATEYNVEIPRVTKIVAGYAANIPVVSNADHVVLYAPDGTVAASGNLISGKVTLRIASAAEGNYVIKGFTDGVEVVSGILPCVPLPVNVWEPVSISQGNGWKIIFGDLITLTATAKMTVNGMPAQTPAVEVDGMSVIVANAAEGDTVKISGIKYADLFPSYSFTFTVILTE